MQIQWPQIVPEGEGGWDAPLAKKYGITSIPSLFLLDSNQQILAQSIRGSALRPAVEAAFKSAENGTAFQNNAEQSLQLSPIAIIACPLLAMLGAFSGTFLELRFNKRAIPELEQIKGTIVLELVEAITELGWVPLLVLAAKQSQIGPIFYVFAALLFLYAGLQIFVIGHYYLGKPDRVEQLASSRFIKTVIKGPWLQRIYADSLVKAGNFRDAQQVYEGIINSQPENRAAPALVRNHLALVLMQNDNPGESELRDPVCVLPATPVVGTPADLSRARSVAIIGYSITVIGIWLSLQN